MSDGESMMTWRTVSDLTRIYNEQCPIHNHILTPKLSWLWEASYLYGNYSIQHIQKRFRESALSICLCLHVRAHMSEGTGKYRLKERDRGSKRGLKQCVVRHLQLWAHCFQWGQWTELPLSVHIAVLVIYRMPQGKQLLRVFTFAVISGAQLAIQKMSLVWSTSCYCLRYVVSCCKFIVCLLWHQLHVYHIFIYLFVYRLLNIHMCIFVIPHFVHLLIDLFISWASGNWKFVCFRFQHSIPPETGYCVQPEAKVQQ